MHNKEKIKEAGKYLSERIIYGVGEIYKSFFTSHKPCKVDASQNY
jgi:hypothetical protein